MNHVHQSMRPALARSLAGPAHVPTGTGSAWPDYEHAEREARNARAFMTAASTCGMHDAADFAPWTEDRDAPRGPNGRRPMRPQTVGEVLAESLDCDPGPDLSEVLALLCKAGDGKDVRADANELLTRMAYAWARHNSDEA